MDNKLFGKKLKELRKSKGFTQQALAEKACIDEKHLSKIENGKYFPTYVTLNKLLNVLGTTLEETGLQIDNIEINTSAIYSKALQILNNAKNDEELGLYLDAIKLVQKIIKHKS